MRAYFLALVASCTFQGLLLAQKQPLVPAQDPDALPIVDVISDNTPITESCRIRLSARTPIRDLDGNGVLHILTDGITVEFVEGSVLRGAKRDAPLDTLEGIGIRIDGAERVTLRNVVVSGFRCGILATEAHGLKVDGARLIRNFAQRLGSTAQVEDSSDWLRPHENDEQEWRKNYGAGICVERSGGVQLMNIHARDQQNGILLDRVFASRVVENDCSYLSGWGLAMWRSSDNEIRGNRFDFCVRGYSHGVYNRGQDSAGILMFEQCSYNKVIGNSASFGGDGIFAFAGQEALGEREPLEGSQSYSRLGNNHNLFLRNRLNYNAAHGLELTFSFGNTIEGNEIIGNAICGIWGGYSQATAIMDNHFRDNGDAGYGLERGAINIDHSRLTHIHGNRFEGDAAGVHLWRLESPFADSPWGQANELAAEDNLVHGNEFRGVEMPIHLRGEVLVAHHGNTYLDLEGEAVAEKDAVHLEGEARWLTNGQSPGTPESALKPEMELVEPAALEGRHNIVMTPWGPWDHDSYQWIRVAREPKFDLYRLYPAEAASEVQFKFLEGGRSCIVRPVNETEPNLGKLYKLRPSMRGLQNYRLAARFGAVVFEHDGIFLGTPWQVRHFASPSDPREDEEAWKTAASEEGAGTTAMDALRLNFGMEGPSGLDRVDHFGTVAELEVTLPAHDWVLTTRSDDGIRVWMNETLVIDDWTHHGAKTHEHRFSFEKAQRMRLRVEHFELDGAALLEVLLRRDL